MKKNKFLLVALVSLYISACGDTKEKGTTPNENSTASAADPGSANNGQTTNTPAAEENNTIRLIKLTLADLHKDDIAKNLIDSMSRQFKYSEYDLNGDGKQEILVGLTGPSFCGSGGCTIYLLTNHGDIITKFSVVRYPVYADAEATSGWKNLIMYSGGEHRVVKWDGKSYPSNPSTLPKAKSEPGDQQTKLLDWDNNTGYKF